jgi:purine-binding chemotaxis protein CheW
MESCFSISTIQLQSRGVTDKRMKRLLVFRLDDWKCALHVSAVEKVHRAVAITPVPGLPEIAMGVVNVHGRVLPVVNLRGRFHLPEKELAPDAYLIVAYTSRRTVVLVVDSVDGVLECKEQEITSASTILPGMEHVEGVLKLNDGMVLIHDLGSFLSIEEDAALDRAVENT